MMYKAEKLTKQDGLSAKWVAFHQLGCSCSQSKEIIKPSPFSLVESNAPPCPVAVNRTFSMVILCAWRMNWEDTKCKMHFLRPQPH